MLEKSLRRGYPEDPKDFFDFEDFGIEGDYLLVPGYSNWDAVAMIPGRRVLIELEEPNRFLSTDPTFNRLGSNHKSLFDFVLTLCPYSQEYFEGDRNGQSVYFPVNPKYLPGETEKVYDVCYSGNLVSRQLNPLFKMMAKYNSCVISSSSHPTVTHGNVSYLEKLRLLSSSRIAVIHNQLFLSSSQIAALSQTLPGFKSHGAFSHLRDVNFISSFMGQKAPQLKSRIFEATAVGTLCLVVEDQWNVHRNWFEPGKHFIPTTWSTLESDLIATLENYSSFAGVVASAKDHTLSKYTTKNFAEDFLMNLG